MLGLSPTIVIADTSSPLSPPDAVVAKNNIISRRYSSSAYGSKELLVDDDSNDSNRLQHDAITTRDSSATATTANTTNVDTLPLHIKVFIEEEFQRTLFAYQSSPEWADGACSAYPPISPELLSVRRLQIINVTSIQSAQQQIYLVQLGMMVRPNSSRSNGESDYIDDPQQSISSPSSSTIATTVLEDALRQGNYYVIVKIWTGTSRWWNCHHIATNTTSTAERSTVSRRQMMGDNTTGEITMGCCSTLDNDVEQRRRQQQHRIAQLEIAHLEIGGYQCAYDVFTSIQNDSVPTIIDPQTIIRLPRVLYSSIADGLVNDDNMMNDDIQQPPPWCILEYVGPYSTNVDHQSSSILTFDTTYIDAMIPIRVEYGYDESHLRWGRLPLHLCIPYTIQILNSFVIPLHCHYFSRVRCTNANPLTGNEDTHCRQINPLHIAQTKTYDFGTMVELLLTKYSKYIAPNIPTISHSGGYDMAYCRLLHDASRMLKVAIYTLFQDEIAASSSFTTIKNLPPVLCHMDLQPQNLIFATSTGSNNDRHDRSTASQVPLPTNNCRILSVLDWEEAAYADPRFELLLLCRKVCANRVQADFVWHYYNERVNEYLSHRDVTDKQQQIQLGSIVPWLKFEAIHSITIMLLECVAGGGRGVCSETIYGTSTTGQTETTAREGRCCHDIKLLSKIQREFKRLYSLRYLFCDTDHWDFTVLGGEEHVTTNT